METRLAVRRCRRRASVLILLLAAAAALAVPTRTFEIVYQRDPQTNLVWKTTSTWTGYMFLPRFLDRDRSPLPAEDSYAVRYALRRAIEVREVRSAANAPVALAEALAIAALAVFDWVIFCRRRRPARPAPPASRA